jgi:phosphatidylinositol glycan class W
MAYNFNQLGLFLIGNLLTGLINISINTLFASYFPTLMILLFYIFLLSAIAWYAKQYKVRIKFWLTLSCCFKAAGKNNTT